MAGANGIPVTGEGVGGNAACTGSHYRSVARPCRLPGAGMGTFVSKDPIGAKGGRDSSGIRPVDTVCPGKVGKDITLNIYILM